jgi:ribonuclease BN (tRNA processing enzyme)
MTEQAANPADAITLTVLGCDTPFPRPGRPCSGYLLRANGYAIWVDAGSGTLAELQRHVGLDEVHAIWLSHLHPDHYVDVLAAWNAYANNTELPRPQVFGPPSWTSRMDVMLGRPGASAQVFDTHELSAGFEVSIGPIVLRAYQMRHSVPTFGLRAEHGDRVVAYSADSGPCDTLVELSKGADLLLVEAGALEPQEFHCTPEEAAEVAVKAGVRRLVLTHLAPGLEPSNAAERGQGKASVRVEIAQVGLHVEI